MIFDLLTLERGGGGGGNLRVNLVRVCGLVFFIPGLRKNDLFIHLIEQNVYIFIYCSLILYTLLLSVNKVYK